MTPKGGWIRDDEGTSPSSRIPQHEGFIGILLLFKCNPGAHCNPWECHTQDDTCTQKNSYHHFIGENLILHPHSQKPPHLTSLTTIFFLDPPNPGESSPKLGSISNSWSKRNNFRASHLAVFFWEELKNFKGFKWERWGRRPKINGPKIWSVSLGVFLFHPTYVKAIKLFHRPLYNWRPILWHFDVRKILESWDPRGTKFLK